MLSFSLLSGTALGFSLSSKALWEIFILALVLLLVSTIIYIFHNRRRMQEQEREEERLRTALEQTKKREKAAADKLIEARAGQAQAKQELEDTKKQLEQNAQAKDLIIHFEGDPQLRQHEEKSRAFLAATAFLVGKDFELVSVIDLNNDSFEVFNEASGELSAGTISYSEASRSFAVDSCVPEDRDKVLWQTSINGLREQLKGREFFELTTDVKESGRLRRKIMRFTRFNGSEDMLLATRRDLTELMERETRQKSALTAALLEAESAQEENSGFISSISRNVRDSFSDVLILSASAEEEAQDEKSKDAFRSIRRSSGAAVSMLADVLDVLELETGKLSVSKDTVSAPDFMADIKTHAQRAANEKKIVYIQRTGGGVPKRLIFDKARTARILNAIINNAVKFSPEGSEISHTVTYSAPANGKVYVRHTITDFGCGMSDAFLPKAASAFTKENAETEGSGLGLYIAQHLAQALNGSLDIVSAQDSGTTVTFTIPASPA